MAGLDKKSLSKRDICTKFITPAVKLAGWDEMSQIREEAGLTKGRIIVRGKLVTRGKAKRADYILYYKPNIPIARPHRGERQHTAWQRQAAEPDVVLCQKAFRTSFSMKNVSRASIYAFAISFPPKVEQHRIVAKVEELKALCDRLEAQLTTTRTESRCLLEAVLHEPLATT